LTVFYAISGAAINGTDYTTLSGNVTIPANQSSVTITITPVDDIAVEGPETVILTINASASYIVGAPATATVTITDND